MSHELRTPLNSIMALSRVLIMQASEKLSDEEADYLEIIERNGKNLLELINDILDLSKIEAGKMDITAKLFRVGNMVETIMERLEPVAAEEDIEMIQNIPDGLPPIKSDEARVHQIIQNLIGNAVKFTEKGSVTVSVNSDETNIYIEVADTGIGIEEKDLPHIFEEFRQIDGGSARKYEGTGLGLAIAGRTAKMLGGDLTVESIIGKGSTFFLMLPVHWDGIIPVSEPLALSAFDETDPAQMPADIEKQSEYSKITGPASAAHILVIEDNEGMIIQLRKVLENEGYNVDVARGGRQALEFVRHTIPDGIILDLMMPEVDGFEVLEKIRGTKASAHIPVLILTAKDLTPGDFKRLSANNIRQLVQKGDVDREELLLKIEKMLGTGPRLKQQAKAQKEKSTPRMPKPVKTMRKKGMPTILIVEDNPDNRIAIKAVLQGEYNILEATDGEEGLSMALAKQPDMVLLDMSLPEMDGFTVVAKIKADEHCAHIPVIALTAMAMKGQKGKMLEAGCDDYISKPIDPVRTLEKIKQWL